MIEVKEVVVRATISERPDNADENGEGANTPNCADSLDGAGGGNNDIVEACVRQVLAILERQKER
jgi:hypothetical protein